MSAHDQFVIQVGGGLTWLAKRHGLNCTETAILSALILLDGPDGCHPQQETVAEVSGRPVKTVKVGLRGLVAKKLIDTYRAQYVDGRGRQLTRKNLTYVFSEDVERAQEFAVETIELKRRSTQPRLGDLPSPADDLDHLLAGDGRTSLVDSNPDRARNGPYLDPDRARNGPYLDQDAGDGGTSLVDSNPDRARNGPYLDPDRARNGPYLDQIGREMAPYRGGGGGGSRSLSENLKIYTPPHHQRHVTEQKLSVEILTHPSIALASEELRRFAADMPAWDILYHCVIFREELDAGHVSGAGVLVHRLRQGFSPRDFTDRELNHPLMEEFRERVGALSEGVAHAAT